MAAATGAGWYELGACRDHPVALFFPGPGGDTRTPKRICERCPVKDQCLDAALAEPEKFGIWGGLTHHERSRLRRGWVRPRKPIVHGTNGGYVAHRKRKEDACPACKQAHTQFTTMHKHRRAAS